MNKNILLKVIGLYDDNTEVKINKIQKSYDEGYYWTFNGTIDGKHEHIKLTYNHGIYRTIRKQTQEVEEVLKP